MICTLDQQPKKSKIVYISGQGQFDTDKALYGRLIATTSDDDKEVYLRIQNESK